MCVCARVCKNKYVFTKIRIGIKVEPEKTNKQAPVDPRKKDRPRMTRLHLGCQVSAASGVEFIGGH